MWIIAENTLTGDGDEHTRPHELVSKVFTPRRVEGPRPLASINASGVEEPPVRLR